MSKTIKSISIDVEINEKLAQERSASDLINRLLKGYYEDAELDEWTEKELKKGRELVKKRDEAIKAVEEFEQDVRRRKNKQ